MEVPGQEQAVQGIPETDGTVSTTDGCMGVRGQGSGVTHSEGGSGLEEFVGVEDLLVVGAEQGAHPSARGEAHATGHLGPPLLLTHCHKAPLGRHHLKHTHKIQNVTQEKINTGH